MSGDPREDAVLALLASFANVESAARELDALFSGTGPGGWRLDGVRVKDGAVSDALLSLRDYLNDLASARGAVSALGASATTASRFVGAET